MRFSWRVGVVVALVGTTWLLAGDGAFRALWPSLVALASVLLLRQVIAGLLVGGFCGALLLEGGRPAAAFISLFEIHLLPAFGSPWKTGAVLFTLILGGFVALIERGGGLLAVFRGLLQGGSRRRLETAAMGMGLVCFFDGLANALMVGRVFANLADRVELSRAKLAYIVDTTSACVACLAFISTWIAYQLAMIQEGLEQAGHAGEWTPYGLFWSSLPHNVYCWFALVLLGGVVWRGWEWGPMKRASRVFPEADPRASEGLGLSQNASAWRALVPLGALVGMTLVGIYIDGVQRLGESVWPLNGVRFARAFGEAQAALVMVWASVLAVMVAIVCYPRAQAVSEDGSEGTDAVAVFTSGAQSLLGPVTILFGAWILSSVLGALGAAEQLGGLLGERVPFTLLPAAVFLVGAITSFSTGTSWGTMGILMPLAVPLVFTLGPADPGAIEWGLAGVIGAVFSGAVFGDHCSPLSDTTIVSSIACGIEPHEHVRTQLPYALLAAGFSLAGFCLSGLLEGPWMGLILGAAGLLGLCWLMTRKSPGSAEISSI